MNEPWRSPSRNTILKIAFALATTAAIGEERTVLDSLSAIRSFDLQAGVRPQVDFEGTLTYVHPIWNFCFVQRAEDAIFVYGDRNPKLKVGAGVRVLGRVDEGDLLPVVRAELLESSPAAAEPVPPKFVEADEVDWLAVDCRKVSLECQVVQVTCFARDTLLWCRYGDQSIVLTISNWELDGSGLMQLVGQRIRCTGVCGLHIEQAAYQLPGKISSPAIHGPKIFCVDLGDIEPIEPQKPQLDLGSVRGLRSLPNDDEPFCTVGQISMIHEQNGFILFDENDAQGVSLRVGI